MNAEMAGTDARTSGTRNLGASSTRALSDLLVLDFTHMLAGPYASMLLADLGARTIKIEPVGRGEGTRSLLAGDPRYSLHGMGAYFLTLNRNKRSICVDLKKPEGKAIVHKLVKEADVVIDNFGPGVMERLGLDHEVLARLNERIITCTITGFGETGPDRDRPAFDLVAQAMGGGMSITGEAGGRPVRAGLPIGDLGAGIFGVIGILSALHARKATGRGQHVDISMLDVQISMLNYMATMYSLSGAVPGPLGNGHPVHIPYGTFRTKTREIVLAVVTDGAWAGLAAALQSPGLAADEYSTQSGRLAHRDLINEQIQAVLETKECEHWLQALGARRVPCAPVNDFAHALRDPQVRARNMVVTVTHPTGGVAEMPGNPIKLSQSYEEIFTPPPLLGQHTEEVLKDHLSMTPEAIAVLREMAVIG